MSSRRAWCQSRLNSSAGRGSSKTHRTSLSRIYQLRMCDYPVIVGYKVIIVNEFKCGPIVLSYGLHQHPVMLADPRSVFEAQQHLSTSVPPVASSLSGSNPSESPFTLTSRCCCSLGGSIGVSQADGGEVGVGVWSVVVGGTGVARGVCVGMGAGVPQARLIVASEANTPMMNAFLISFYLHAFLSNSRRARSGHAVGRTAMPCRNSSRGTGSLAQNHPSH